MHILFIWKINKRLLLLLEKRENDLSVSTIEAGDQKFFWGTTLALYWRHNPVTMKELAIYYFFKRSDQQ